jgi:hypothetical protein
VEHIREYLIARGRFNPAVNLAAFRKGNQ